MFWVLQDNFFDPQAFAELRRQLHIQGAAHAVVRVNSRTLELDPEIEVDGPIFVCGSSSLGRAAAARGWRPGYIDEHLDYRLLVRHYGEHLLNADALCVRLADAPEPAGPVFVRPAGDGKQFAGSVMSAAAFADWRRDAPRALPRLHPSDLVVIARPKTLHAEYRLRIVDGVIVTASQYKRGDAVFWSEHVDERVLDFGRARVAQWSPNRAFCLDVADTPDGLKVVEINAIGSSAFYASDIARFVAAINAMTPPDMPESIPPHRCTP